MAFLLLCCRLLFLFPSLYSPSIFVTGGIPAAAFSASVSVSVSVFSRLAYHELRTGRPEAYQDLNVRMDGKMANYLQYSERHLLLPRFPQAQHHALELDDRIWRSSAGVLLLR